jgi:tellurite methyltransferase
MAEERRALWDARHAEAEGVGTVAAVLQRNAALLPSNGRALDLACGRGANALWLAARGLEVSAWDYSAVAIERLQAAAAAQTLDIDAAARDVLAAPPPPDSFDLILVSHFLERELCPAIAAALRPGGLLCYQTFGPAVPGGAGPSNPAFRLAANELLRLFPTLTVRDYHEPDALAPADDPLRGLALLVAQRPQHDPVRV